MAQSASFRLAPDARILIAPASFKGSLSAWDAAAAMADGLHDALPSAHPDLLPLADGGEGLVSVLAGPMNAGIRRSRVHGPLPDQMVDAEWGFAHASGTAIIEMAAAAGLGLVPASRRDPRRTTTYGVGELILAAIDAGAERIILGLGGSATNDAGAGLAEALGVRFLDRNGDSLARGGGASLADLDRIDCSMLDPRLSRLTVTAAVDVQSPLTGSAGATAVYGPQKGLRPGDLPSLDRALENFARVAARDCGQDIASLPGAGAAGGLGAAAVLFCRAALRPGIEIVLDALRFDDLLRRADLVLTGEGSLDAQTRHGKAIWGILSRTGPLAVPVAAVVGKTDPPLHGEGQNSDLAGGSAPWGLADLDTLVDAKTSELSAMREAGPLLRMRTAALVRRHLSP